MPLMPPSHGSLRMFMAITCALPNLTKQRSSSKPILRFLPEPKKQTNNVVQSDRRSSSVQQAKSLQVGLCQSTQPNFWLFATEKALNTMPA